MTIVEQHHEVAGSVVRDCQVRIAVTMAWAAGDAIATSLSPSPSKSPAVMPQGFPTTTVAAAKLPLPLLISTVAELAL
jgi:hypothetical protein